MTLPVARSPAMERACWTRSAAVAWIRSATPDSSLGSLLGEDHLNHVQIGADAIGKAGRPPDRPLGRLRPVGPNHHTTSD